MSRYQKGETNLDSTGASDSEWQWHQLGHVQVCTSLETDNHASTSLLSFLQAGRPSRRPTNSVNALKAKTTRWYKVRTNLPPPTYENAPTRLVLSYTNNAVNFFMYFVSGSKFRVAFADTFSRARAAVTENMILSFG